MPFPKQHEVELPLLRVLSELGGEAEPKDVYPRVAKYFPALTAEEQEERLENYPSTRKWTNLVQWVRQRLVDAGQVDSPCRGIWRVTTSGSARLKAGAVTPAAASASMQLGLRDLAISATDEIRSRLVATLRELSPRAFEHFCRELLAHLGYRNVEVTKRSQDGGIDGYGDFRQGAVSIRSAFQAKRWTQGGVGRPEIDQFRGAIQGDFDHGVFLTTSHFTKPAKEASVKKGAISVLLLDGESIADLLIERGLGVRKVPVVTYEVDDDFFDLEGIDE